MSKALLEIKSILSGTGTMKIPKLIKEDTQRQTPNGSASSRVSKAIPTKPLVFDNYSNSANGKLKLSPKIEPKFKAKLKAKAE